MFNMTIKLGAGLDTVIIDGHTFDRTDMDRASNNKLRRMIVQAFKQEKDQ